MLGFSVKGDYTLAILGKLAQITLERAFIRIITMPPALTHIAQWCALWPIAFISQIWSFRQKWFVKTLWVLTRSFLSDSSLKIASIDYFLATSGLVFQEWVLEWTDWHCSVIVIVGLVTFKEHILVFSIRKLRYSLHTWLILFFLFRKFSFNTYVLIGMVRILIETTTLFREFWGSITVLSLVVRCTICCYWGIEVKPVWLCVCIEYCSWLSSVVLLCTWSTLL